MSKQIYIDSNGNEVQVSGTVNSADMMPMSGNDSTKVSEAIGDLSQLTTTVTSSLVGAVNELDSDKADKTATVTMSMEGTFRKERFSGGVNDKIVSFSASIGGIVDITLNNLTKVATISKAPTDDCIVPTINVENGATVGYIRIYTNGDIKLYKSASGNYCGFSVNYATS